MSSLITNATIQIRQDTAGNWTSTNPTPAAGEWCKEIDTGAIKQGDGSTAWNDLEYRQQLPFTNDLTSGNITHTLPVITGYPQSESIYATNGGTYKLTLAVTDSELVGGLVASTWQIEGEGRIFVESDGTNWQVREYEDYLQFNNASDDQYIWKKKDGTEKQLILNVLTSLAVDNASGSIFRSNVIAVVTRDHALDSLMLESTYIHITAGNSVTWIVKASGSSGRGTVTSTATYYIADASSDATDDYTVGQKAIGRWRT